MYSTGCSRLTLRSSEAVEFGEALRAKIAGQEEAEQAMVDLYQVSCAGLNSPGRKLFRPGANCWKQ